jgi:hypothetical protein
MWNRLLFEIDQYESGQPGARSSAWRAKISFECWRSALATPRPASVISMSVCSWLSALTPPTEYRFRISGGPARCRKKRHDHRPGAHCAHPRAAPPMRSRELLSRRQRGHVPGATANPNAWEDPTS